MPHDIHIIRLRGPWFLEPLARFVPQPDGTYFSSSKDLPTPGKLTMPADWAQCFGNDFFGRVCYRRLFHGPTGLESGERAVLVVEPPRSRGTIALSGRLLGEVAWGQPPARFDITDMLQERNQLEIVVEHPALDAVAQRDDDDFRSSPGGLVGEVRLEIEE